MIDKIFQLLKISGSNNFSFSFQKEGTENYIKYSVDEKSIIINVVNPDDPNLENMLNEKLKELQQLLN